MLDGTGGALGSPLSGAQTDMLNTLAAQLDNPPAMRKGLFRQFAELASSEQTAPTSRGISIAQHAAHPIRGGENLLELSQLSLLKYL
jgi:hypothetical protein